MIEHGLEEVKKRKKTSGCLNSERDSLVGVLLFDGPPPTARLRESGELIFVRFGSCETKQRDVINKEVVFYQISSSSFLPGLKDYHQ